jgi:hypothetical protein
LPVVTSQILTHRIAQKAADVIQIISSLPFAALICLALWVEHLVFGPITKETVITKEVYVERLVTGVTTIIIPFILWLLVCEGQGLPIFYWQPILVIIGFFGVGLFTTWSVYSHDERKARRDASLVDLGVSIGSDQTTGDDRAG